MWPSLIPFENLSRAPVDSDLASFYVGTQARAFREVSLAAGVVLYMRMIRQTNIAIRRFSLYVNAGELRCEIYRGATPDGVWSENIPVILKCETSLRPLPLYASKSRLEAGGTFSGGTIYDVIHVKTSGAGGQQLTVGNTSDDVLGAPPGIGWYKFSNPGNSAAAGLFSMWWEELA